MNKTILNHTRIYILVYGTGVSVLYHRYHQKKGKRKEKKEGKRKEQRGECLCKIEEQSSIGIRRSSSTMACDRHSQSGGFEGPIGHLRCLYHDLQFWGDPAAAAEAAPVSQPAEATHWPFLSRLAVGAFGMITTNSGIFLLAPSDDTLVELPGAPDTLSSPALQSALARSR